MTLSKEQRCQYCTNIIAVNSYTLHWWDALGSGCIESPDGFHHPVGEPPC